MSLFDDAIANAMDVWFGSDYAITVKYSGVDIPAHVEYEENLDEDNRSAMAKAILTVQCSDVAAPAYRDPVLIGSDTWRVRNVIDGDAYSWRLALYRDERPVL